MERAAHGGRRRIDGDDLGARLRAVEPVGAVGLPPRRPLLLETFETGLVRSRHARSVYETACVAPAAQTPLLASQKRPSRYFSDAKTIRRSGASARRR